MSRLPRLAALAASLCCLALPAQAEPIHYTASLSGPAESPPNNSPARGFGTVDYDSTLHLLRIFMYWTGLTGTTTTSHIHCCTALPDEGTAGVAVTAPTLPGFPEGVTEGTYQALLDLNNPANFGASFLALFGGRRESAEEALAAGLAESRAYLNIHTVTFPGGEIRGFLHVPEPGALALAGLALVAAGGMRRRARPLTPPSAPQPPAA